MRLVHLLAAAGLSTLLGQVAGAQEIHPARTVQTLYEACQHDDAIFIMRCKAYLAGVADALHFLAVYQQAHATELRNAGLTVAPFAICHDEAWNPEMLRSLVVPWAERHPERRQDDQYAGAMQALTVAWPCR